MVFFFGLFKLFIYFPLLDPMSDTILFQFYSDRASVQEMCSYHMTRVLPGCARKTSHLIKNKFEQVILFFFPDE